MLNKRILLYKASFPEIRKITEEAIADLQSNGFYDPKVTEKRVHLLYDKKTALLNLTIIPGQRVRFSKTKVTAFPEISESYIRNRIEWDEGELFNINKIDQTVKNLRSSQIFSEIKIEPDVDQKEDDKMPMNIVAGKNKSKAIDFSLLYAGTNRSKFKNNSATNKKLTSLVAKLSWTNFNAFGCGEKLKFIVEGNPGKNKVDKDGDEDHKSKYRDYLFEVLMSKPDVFFKNLSFEADVSRKQELTNAFFKKCDKISVALEYPLSSKIHARISGVSEKNYLDGYRIFFENERMHRGYENYSIPIEIFIDETNDFLNPTSGYKAGVKFVRTQFHNASLNGMNLIGLNFSYNHSLDESARNVLAFSIEYKCVMNGGIDDIPLDKRIYAGGLGSVRGFGNQMASEVISNEKIPAGGKASLEFNAEYRRKINSTIGVVAFLDGARIYKNRSRIRELAIEKKRWFLSAGLGLRYFSSIGPIRVDLAFPLKRRKGIDSKMQFIISLGQAF